MPAESAQQFEALEARAGVMMEVFGGAGYERVAPTIVQPAEVFLDRVGEAIRGRTYVFSDLDGAMLCLRPDLTVPVCRLYLERHPGANVEARYCYNGPAFRYQPEGSDAVQPREFRQAGIELIGGDTPHEGEAEVFALTLEAVRAADLTDFKVHLGDLGLFEALIGAIDMPQRWRSALWDTFWRPPVFHDRLRRLAANDGAADRALPMSLIRKLDIDDFEVSEREVEAYLDRQGVPIIGTRSIAEITERLLDQAADARAEKFSEDAVRLIEDYLAVSGPPRAAAARIADLAREAGVDLDAALHSFSARLDRLAGYDIDVNATAFGAEFGRNIEYYTGFVFQLELPARGRAGQIAGGGRYDGLMTELGAPQRVPAVGCAIHTERLLAAIEGAPA